MGTVNPYTIRDTITRDNLYYHAIRNFSHMITETFGNDRFPEFIYFTSPDEDSTNILLDDCIAFNDDYDLEDIFNFTEDLQSYVANLKDSDPDNVYIEICESLLSYFLILASYLLDKDQYLSIVVNSKSVSRIIPHTIMVGSAMDRIDNTIKKVFFPTSLQ